MSDIETTATVRDLDPEPAGASTSEVAPPAAPTGAEADAPSIGQQIRAAREARGMTMAELGALAGTSKYTISKIELGKITDSSYLPRILEILELSPDLIVEDARRRALLTIAARASRAAAGREGAASRSETSARLASDSRRSPPSGWSCAASRARWCRSSSTGRSATCMRSSRRRRRRPARCAR
jgi:transcriptional regulator with XRE-family HTH domain